MLIMLLAALLLLRPLLLLPPIGCLRRAPSTFPFQPLVFRRKVRRSKAQQGAGLCSSRLLARDPGAAGANAPLQAKSSLRARSSPRGSRRGVHRTHPRACIPRPPGPGPPQATTSVALMPFRTEEGYLRRRSSHGCSAVHAGVAVRARARTRRPSRSPVRYFIVLCDQARPAARNAELACGLVEVARGACGRAGLSERAAMMQLLKRSEPRAARPING
jgi:hypothetical protein